MESGIKVPLFTYKEAFTSKDSTEFQKVGQHCRVRITDTFTKVDEDLKREFGEGFELFEVCRDPKNGYCRILSCFS